MTKRTKKKIAKVIFSILGFIVSKIFKLINDTIREMLAFCKEMNIFLKNFSTISFLVTISAIFLFISLIFGPFKVCEFLVACWMCEVLWIWFHGEC